MYIPQACGMHYLEMITTFYHTFINVTAIIVIMIAFITNHTKKVVLVHVYKLTEYVVQQG